MSNAAKALEVVLVGCSSSKLDHKAPARDLYTGALFRASRAYAEARGLPWAILSAKHFAVMPEDELEPYDFTFKDLKAASLSPNASMEAWGREVQQDLRAQWPEATYIFLGGADYSICLNGLETRVIEGRTHSRCNGLNSVEPLQGMGIGQKIAWLKRETAALLHAKPWNRCPKCLDLVDVDSESHDGTEARCFACDLALVVVELDDGTFRLSEQEGVDVEESRCDFCGADKACAVSELGNQRFEGDDTPARICESCAQWALGQFRIPALAEGSPS